MKAHHLGHWGLSLVLGVAWSSYIVTAEPENAVTRVVGLLESLKSRIEKDGEAEQKTYDKYACWCESTTKSTANTITEVRDTLKATGTTILKLKGSVATLASEISGLAADIKKNEEQQAEQTSIREKENAAFMAEKVETESALSALEKAIAVLKAATSASALLQTSHWQSTMSDVVAAVQTASVQGKLNARQISALSTLVGKGERYAPQSATIQGILGDMYTTFSSNLETSTHDEATAHRNYEDLMATYQKQMITMQESLVKKEKEKSEDELQLADATQQYADSEEQLKAEIEMFDATKKSCTEKTEAWSERSQLRTSEAIEDTSGDGKS
jgi:predicted  nucleic acid-binding Zn-ribbon protein